MKEFKITEEQLTKLLEFVSQIPLGQSINAFSILQEIANKGLIEAEEEPEEE